jgi:hypothetical protein
VYLTLATLARFYFICFLSNLLYNKYSKVKEEKTSIQQAVSSGSSPEFSPNLECDTTTPTLDQPYLPPQRRHRYTGKCSVVSELFRFEHIPELSKSYPDPDPDFGHGSAYLLAVLFSPAILSYYYSNNP